MSTYGPDATCTLTTCDVRDSLYQYRPSLAANVIFTIIFFIVLVIQIVQGVKWRTWGYLVAMTLGCITEIIGYGAGRILLWQNPFSFTGFITQIVCITFAPAFYSAAIYLTLSRITIYLGREYSRFAPKLFYWLFIPCDLVSLTLQAAGGAISSTSTGSNEAGVNIAIAGLVFQVFTLIVFCALAADYAIRYLRGRKSSTNKTPLSTSFKIFAMSQAAAIVFILIRCIYRIDELSEGYDGPLISDEPLFIALEGAMVAAAAILLCIGHPGYGMGRTPSGAFSSRDVEHQEVNVEK